VVNHDPQKKILKRDDEVDLLHTPATGLGRRRQKARRPSGGGEVQRDVTIRQGYKRVFERKGSQRTKTSGVTGNLSL